MRKRMLVAVAALVGALGLGSLPARSMPVAANLGALGLAHQGGSSLQRVHWRGFRHCHWRHGWRRCHGGYHHYGYYPYRYWGWGPGIYFRFGGHHHHHHHRHHRRWH